MIKTPDQELFDAVYTISNKFGYSTYDHLSTDEIPYPFVVLGDTQIVSPPTKVTGIAPNISIRVDAWGNKKQRQEVSNMLNALLKAARQLHRTQNYTWQIRNQASSPQLIGDNSTGSFLWHGILEIEMKLK